MNTNRAAVNGTAVVVVVVLVGNVVDVVVVVAGVDGVIRLGTARDWSIVVALNV